jgi:Sec-independent protein translocase protein TatA
MGLGTELPLLLALGFVVLGPKRMQEVLGHIAKVKAEFYKLSRALQSQVLEETQSARPHIEPGSGRTESE